MRITTASTDQAGGMPESREVPECPDLISAIEAPFFIGHRGSNRHFPEHSMEGYRAVAADGFPAEPDVRALADGTLVCIHDDSVDRTMTSITGDVATLTQDQWSAARIRPVHPDGPDARPVLFEEVLDELGGQVLLVPEIKIYDPVSVDAFVAAIVSRGLERGVLAQSFDYPVARRLIAAGIPALLLIGAARSLPDSYEHIREAGIEYVGPNTIADSAVIADAARAGLRSVVWTVNSREAALRELERGAFGVFSDDVWAASGREFRG